MPNAREKMLAEVEEYARERTQQAENIDDPGTLLEIEEDAEAVGQRLFAAYHALRRAGLIAYTRRTGIQRDREYPRAGRRQA